MLQKIASSNYAWMWQQVWNEPLRYSNQAQIDLNYNRVGLAIAAYEASPEVNQFSSKYDYYLQGLVDLTEQEEQGLVLFNGKGKCGECHTSTSTIINDTEIPPLFTDFTFDNLGVPKNPENPFYDMDRIFLSPGNPINPEGSAWIDKGLGGYYASSSRLVWRKNSSPEIGNLFFSGPLGRRPQACFDQS